ncbi:5924_t:CDS:2, partial [Scutellospora calospora]
TTISKYLVSNMNDAKKENINNYYNRNFENTENKTTTFQATSFISSTKSDISRVESINAYLKRLLYNSNISLCELMQEIYKLLDQQDKQNQYKYWRLAIPTVKNIEQANFLFTEKLSKSNYKQEPMYINETEVSELPLTQSKSSSLTQLKDSSSKAICTK